MEAENLNSDFHSSIRCEDYKGTEVRAWENYVANSLQVPIVEIIDQTVDYFSLCFQKTVYNLYVIHVC